MEGEVGGAAEIVLIHSPAATDDGNSEKPVYHVPSEHLLGGRSEWYSSLPVLE
jgi:hypothetical protein